MDCKYVADKVWLYVEGDLQPSKQNIIARHIAACPECACLVDEVTSSQQWLKSREPERFDDTALDSIRRGARQKIAELGDKRFKSLGLFDRLSWKLLIISCPILLLLFLFATHWIVETGHNSSGPNSIARKDGYIQKEPENSTDGPPDNSVGAKVKNPIERPRKRRAVRRIRPAPAGGARDQGSQVARGEPYQVPTLRIEIQTEDPDVRIIWFASPGDVPVPSGPDKNEP